MKRLGLDLDGTLINWHESVLEYYKMFRGFDGTDSSFWTTFYKTIPDDEFNFITQIEFLYTNRQPDADCRSFIDCVKDRFEIYYITARPSIARLTTEQYLRKYNFPFQENLIFTDDKVNAARLLKLDYFIEDMPNHVKALSDVVFTIMRSRPWNKDIWYEYPTVTKLMESMQYLED